MLKKNLYQANISNGRIEGWKRTIGELKGLRKDAKHPRTILGWQEGYHCLEVRSYGADDIDALIGKYMGYVASETIKLDALMNETEEVN